MKRIMGIDYGDARTGVALSDLLCTLVGATTVVPSHNREKALADIVRIAKENEGKTVLVATHAAVIRAFWGKITKTPENEVAQRIQFPKNASCTTVIYEKGELLPVEYGFADYLEG